MGGANQCAVHSLSSPVYVGRQGATGSGVISPRGGLMMMHHPIHSQRYGRAKGLKVKHLAQLVVLTVLFTWFLYQLNSSHKAKVVSQRVEKENDIDDELLISDDNSAIDRIGADLDDITAGEVAQDEFIDKKSVSRTRKMLPGLADSSELEQRIDERDRAEGLAEDLFDDSGEGDREERGAKWTDEADLEHKGGERERVLGEGRHKFLPYPKRPTETAEDRGDREDELKVEMSTREEFGAREGWVTPRNSTETVEVDDILVGSRSEGSKVRGTDVPEVQTGTNSIDTNTDHVEIPDREAKLGGSKSSESNVLMLWTTEDSKKNLTELDDGAVHDLDVSDETESEGLVETQDSSEETDVHDIRQNGEMPTAPFDANSDAVALVARGHSKEINGTGKMNATIPQEFDNGVGDGDSPVPLESGAGAKAEQGRGTGTTEALLGDGQETSVAEFKQQDELLQQVAMVEAVSVGKAKQQAQEEAIAEVVSVGKQTQQAQEEAIAEVVSVGKQTQQAQQEAIAEVVSVGKQKQQDQKEAFAEIISAAKQHRSEEA